MTREQVKELLPIIKAFSEGKTIQCLNIDNNWEVKDNPAFNVSPEKYRIKPEPTYRPFKNAEECWQEMQKHQPFGWVKKEDLVNEIFCIIKCICKGCVNINAQSPAVGIYPAEYRYKDAYENFTFADGTPFGIKEVNPNT